MPRRCWTCNNEHEMDAACPASHAARTRRNAGPLDDFTSDDLFDDPSSGKLGPIFPAGYETDDACCGYGIEAGDKIRADGSGGWIHADEECERKWARS